MALHAQLLPVRSIPQKWPLSEGGYLVNPPGFRHLTYECSKKAKTPIIAGSICGGVLLLAWVIGFIIYFRKRSNRKKRNRLIAEGKATPRAKDLEAVKEKIVIPPDPAVLLGQAQPGQQLFPERQNSKESHRHRPHTSRHSTYTKTNKQLPNGSGLEANITPQTTNARISETPDDDVVEQMKVPPNA